MSRNEFAHDAAIALAAKETSDPVEFARLYFKLLPELKEAYDIASREQPPRMAKIGN